MSQTPHGQRVSARNIQENNDQPLVYPRMRFDDEARIMDGMVQSFVHWYNNAWYLGVRYIDESNMIVRDERFVKHLVSVFSSTKQPEYCNSEM